MYKEGSVYRKTTYQFPDKVKECTTSLFLKAIIETEYWQPIKKVILIGTTSSSWNVLVPDGVENTDLGVKIIDECEKNAFCDESKKELETKLSEWYNNIKFEIAIHTNEVNEANVGMVFNKYMDIPGMLEPETDILFDITHGFRSMPLLIFQSLQLNSSLIKGRKVELVYGEYIKDKEISYVRDLTKYWDYYEISSAIKLFDEKWDGKILAEKIKPYWESGSKFLLRFTEIVECNFSLQIPEALKQLKNALTDYKETNEHQWVTDVWKRLDNIYKELNQKDSEKYPVAKTVWEYSKLLRDKKMITQAVIALQVVPETAIAEKYNPSKIGDFGWFNGYFDEKKSMKIEGVGDKKLKQKDSENYPVAKTVWEYSKLLRKKNLITQAIIALQVVTETAIAEKYDPTKIGDYSWFRGYFNVKHSIKFKGKGETKLDNICKKNYEMKSSLNKLEDQRNQIAHGGWKDKKGKYPNQTDIKLTLQTIDNYIKEFLIALDEEK